ncbi:Glyco-hydro-19-cat domain-containing protein [Aphelenchoides besseyi]|nr:Glyco-hydro-19-cat domain-containing protein [Aphelenchoides besseyi]
MTLFPMFSDVCLLFSTKLFVLILLSVNPTDAVICPEGKKYGRPPVTKCREPMDPNLKPKTYLERWFTKEMFDDFFPHANQGWGGSLCSPYSYESFIIAARYFPEFGAGLRSGQPPFTSRDLQRRDVAAFFAHVVAETGENDYKLFRTAQECFYRGGLYHFFEGGPKSKLFATVRHGFTIKEAETCVKDGRYCASNPELDFWYPCEQPNTLSTHNQTTYTGCYFGRGPLQLSWNYNYGQFQHYLHSENIDVDLLTDPNILITKMDPPLAMLSALWFYNTPQPPKPSMHDIMMGTWHPSEKNKRAGYKGSVFGPTNKVINDECKGEDDETPGGPGENRRIKAFRFFCEKLGVPVGLEHTLSCKGMIDGFDAIQQHLSWQPDWSNMWKPEPCDCAPAPYPGVLPYFDPKLYHDHATRNNDRNRLRCVFSLYRNPDIFHIDPQNSPCLNHTVRIRLSRYGPE